MSEPDPARTPLQTVVDRVKELRRERGWTAQRLAEEMTRVGFPWEQGVVTKLETNRRKSFGIEELMGLAYALRVSPLALLLPSENVDYSVTPNATVKAATAYEWMTGDLLPPLSPGSGGHSDEDRARAIQEFVAKVPYAGDLGRLALVSAQSEVMAAIAQEREQMRVELLAEVRMEARRIFDDEMSKYPRDGIRVSDEE